MIKVFTLVAVMLALTPTAAIAKGKPATKDHGKVTSITAVNAGGFVCDNQWQMQNTDQYALVCFSCPTLPDGPGGAIAWVPQIWAVLKSDFDNGIALTQYTYGCTDWYYFA